MASLRGLILAASLLLASFPVPSSQAQPRAPRAARPAPKPPSPERVVAVLDRIRSQLQTSKYSHATIIDEHKGRYDFDCSGMASWILRQAAPVALMATGSPRPLAVDFFRTITHAPVTGERFGWRRLERIADAAPGDVLAWQRPPWFRSASTGHVAFVVAPPTAYPEVPGAYLVRVADASKFNHDRDTRMGGTGFGIGTMLVMTNTATGDGAGYGWYGARSETVVPTRVVIGRVVR